ncbi:hypothetical protein [Clostridium perfringens]|uniref:hypothetical protein n=1 Tax=Clostridium perfringens TaxID=1502 RepID=UPI0008A6CADA|nr:hypothetical protein [Clostridium perfringens]AOY53845.1 Phage-related protein [Clostridium perfringens]MDK0856940.1 hypothetical protein [Clostridium perfringens]MDM0730225.1 hypothetical protein [Clostridium perfringens]
MKPILFNTAMVRAILDGEKTCSRRIIKKEIPGGYKPLGFVLYPTDDKELGNLVFGGKGANVYYAKPPYKVGDILYVRETWANTWTPDGDIGFVYKADGEPKNFPYWGNAKQGKHEVWMPSIHMPKEAARIFLKVTSVRAERLKDITDEGCLSEGIREFTKDGIVKKYDTEPNMHTWQEMPRTPKGAFEKLWNSTVNVKKYWDGWTNLFEYNPWVWVIEFEKVEK